MALVDDYPIMRVVSAWRDLFALGISQPKIWTEICSERGVSLARVGYALSPLNRRQLERYLSDNENLRLQVSAEPFEVFGKPVAGVSINIITADGKLLGWQRASQVLVKDPRQ
jgi:hypothetical protein